MKIKLILIIAVIALLSAVPASADVLSLSQSGADWKIFATRPTGVDAIGGFDIDLSFPVALGYISTDYGLKLGDPALFEALENPPIVGVGTLNIAEGSLLSNADLSTLQVDPILLATLHFTALGSPGDVLITRADLADGFGNPIGATPPIPEPSSWILLLTTVAVVSTALRHRRSA